jgi:teichuronic acid biosynthesis glycosyltransferase TuaH
MGRDLDAALHALKRPESSLEQPWPESAGGLVVLRAANSWDGPWFADQQLATSLSKLVPVLYVDPALSCLGDVPNDALVKPWIRSLGPRLTRLSPVAMPGRHRFGLSRLTSSLVRRGIVRTARESGVRVEALIDCFPLAPVLGRCGEKRRIYWAQDDFAAMADLIGVSGARMRRGELHLARRADLIVAANEGVAKEMSRFGRPAALIPFGCDPGVFGRTIDCEPAADIRLEGPIAGFMGHIGERIDVALLDAVAAAGISVLMVGPKHPRFEVHALDSLLGRPNVQWVGPRRFDELPAYLAAVGVGLVPYNHSPFNEASFPLKTLEYLAAGLPVVATDLPAIRWLDCPFIEVADTASNFANAVSRALDTPLDRRARQALQDFAGAHTWDVRATQFLQAMADVKPT